MSRRPGSGDDLLAAYRRERGPSPAVEDRMWERLQSARDGIESDANDSAIVVRPVFGRRTAIVTAVALAAAAALVLSLSRGQSVDPQAAADPKALSAHAADEPERAHAVQSRHGAADSDASSANANADAPDPSASAATSIGSEPEASASATDPSPASVSAPGSSSAEQHTLDRAPRRSSPRPRATDDAPAPAEQDTLAAETAVLARARGALSEGAPGRALAILREYERAFGGGRLAEEADAVRTMARCRMNPPDPAAIAREFAARHASSIFHKQVAAACGDPK